jgi:hypothetical protein
MERVTRKEVKKAVGKYQEKKEYCICLDCYCAFKITDKEQTDFDRVCCGSCGSFCFVHVLNFENHIDRIIDPEMSEAMRKFGKEEGFKSGDICKVCGEQWGDHHFLECPEPPRAKPYYCLVEGMNTPRVEHCTLDEAEREADRLATLPDNIGHKVHVMQVINTRASKVTIERE